VEVKMTKTKLCVSIYGTSGLSRYGGHRTFYPDVPDDMVDLRLFLDKLEQEPEAAKLDIFEKVINY